MKKLVCLPHDKYKALINRFSPSPEIQTPLAAPPPPPEPSPMPPLPPREGAAVVETDAKTICPQHRRCTQNGAGPLSRPPPPGLPLGRRKKRVLEKEGWMKKWTSI